MRWNTGLSIRTPPTPGKNGGICEPPWHPFSPTPLLMSRVESSSSGCCLVTMTRWVAHGYQMSFVELRCCCCTCCCLSCVVSVMLCELVLCWYVALQNRLATCVAKPPPASHLRVPTTSSCHLCVPTTPSHRCFTYPTPYVYSNAYTQTSPTCCLTHCGFMQARNSTTTGLPPVVYHVIMMMCCWTQRTPVPTWAFKHRGWVCEGVKKQHVAIIYPSCWCSLLVCLCFQRIIMLLAYAHVAHTPHTHCNTDNNIHTTQYTSNTSPSPSPPPVGLPLQTAALVCV